MKSGLSRRIEEVMRDERGNALVTVLAILFVISTTAIGFSKLTASIEGADAAGQKIARGPPPSTTIPTP